MPNQIIQLTSAGPLKKKNKKKKNKNAKKQKQSQSQTQQFAIPAAVGTKVSGGKNPKFTPKPDGSVTIAHREFIRDLNISDLSTAAPIAINPQRAEVFPWLSAIATRYEMFRFKKLVFKYEPTCSTATDGYVIMGFDFDALDAAQGKAAMLAWKYASKSALWQTCTLNVSSDSRLSTFRYNNYTTQGDARLDLLGNLFCLAHSSATTATGELFVEYVVEFRQPAYKLPPVVAGSVAKGSWSANYDGQNWFDGTITKTGNANITVVDKNHALLNDIGKYLITLYTEATNPGAPTLNVTAPSSNPDAAFTSVLGNFTNSAAKAMTEYIVEVLNAPVLLAPNLPSGTSVTSSALKLATYFL